MAATVVDHPILRTSLTLLRDRETPPARFREAIERAALLLAAEALKRLATVARPVETPLEAATGDALREQPLFVPILRAGLGMIEPFLRLAPDARVAHGGLRRDERTLAPTRYYEKMPERLDTTEVFLLDPMLATGGSAAHAIERLRGRGARRITLVCLLAAPEGIAMLERAHPEVAILTAAVDRGLDGNGYIRPGLGDAGDRSFGV
jgi:uracil phosphoribosyltransferase